MREFTRQLALLLKSGQTEAEAVWAISSETPPGRFNFVVCDVVERLRMGLPLSVALDAHPAYFDSSYVGMVRVGEASGTLADTVADLDELARRPSFAADKLVLAVGLPVLFTLAVLAFVTFLSRAVVPKLAVWDFDIYGSSKSLSFAAWVWRRGPLLPLMAAGLGVVVLIVFDVLCYRPARKSLLLSRLAASLKTMVKVNLPLEEIEQAARGLSGSFTYRAAIKKLFRALQSGHSFTEAFRRVSYFPETFRWLVAAGEHRGELPGALADAASVYTVRADAKLAVILNIMPPILMIALGALVGLFCYAFFSMFIGVIDHLL